MIASIATAEMKNTARHDVTAAIALAIGRDSKMPSNSPLITLPTTAPRLCSGARWAASGTSTRRILA